MQADMTKDVCGLPHSDTLPTVKVQAETATGWMLVNRSDYKEDGAFPPSEYPLYEPKKAAPPK